MLKSYEKLEFDVLIVGAGPAGLSCAIKLKQLAIEQNKEIEICLIEKASAIGGHIVSGAVIETHGLDELIPNWKETDIPVTTKVTTDDVYWFISSKLALKVPSFFTPKLMHNKGNYIVSLSQLCGFLGEYAANLGINIFPQTAAQSILYEDDKVVGVRTQASGVAKDGTQKASYVEPIDLLADYTVFAEGCRGSLGKELIKKYELDKDCSTPYYALGVKEVWEISNPDLPLGAVIHTFGWPLSKSGATGGGFLYHFAPNLVSLGLITDLTYKNPTISPFSEMQQFKTHPKIASILEKGKRIGYGARSINKSVLSSMPKISFAGGLLIGDEAGSLNAAKIKGVHTAMKFGMLAAKEIISNFDTKSELTSIKNSFKNSWLYDELYAQRNFAPALAKWGNVLGGAYNWFDQQYLQGRQSHTITIDKYAYNLHHVGSFTPIKYPTPDKILTFDLPSSVYLTSISYDHDQPNHIKLKDDSIPIKVNLSRYSEPAQYYCPAGVFEILGTNDDKYLQINSQNCIHCKTCDIKDPMQNITWTTPEGGSGPSYQIL